MRRVYILGAGASATFQSEKGRCPTISEFFIRASDLGLFERYRSEDMMRPLFRFVQREFGVRKQALRYTPLNIEDVLTRLDTVIEEFHNHGQYLIKGRKQRSKKGFTLVTTRFQAIAFIGHVLLELTNDKLSPLHEKLARNLSDGDVVISFNYDLLMDSALESTGRWWPHSGYGIPFEAVIVDGAFLPLLQVATPSILYLKLHGSLNWLHGHNPYTMLFGMPVPFGQHVFLLRKINHEIVAGPIDIAGKYEHTENGIYYDLHSLIVAPRTDKPYESFPDVFNHLWNEAAAAIQQSDELILIGYSIPETDTRSNELIRVARSSKARQPALTVVDKAPEPVIEKLKKLLGYEPSGVYKGFEEYLASLG